MYVTFTLFLCIGKCTFLHEYSPDFITKKLEQEKKLREVAERERDDALKFSTVRENMKKSMKKFKVDFAAQLKKANTLDLVIVMDCTGSMGAWIETAKAEIGRIIDSIKSEHVGVTARVGFVAYRDFCDGPSRLSTLPLTENIEKVKEFIARQSATGGGDGPEDIPGGLDEAIKLDWRAEAKLILLVNDAPCHGEEYHDPGMSDSNDSISGMKKYQSPCIRQQMRQLCKEGFDFAYIELQPEHTKKMATILEKEFNSEVPHDGVKRSFKRTLLGSATETYKFATILKSSASDSLSSSKSRSVSSLKRAAGVSSLHHYGPTGKADKSSLYSIKESSSHISTEISKLDWKEIDRLPVITARRNTLHVRPGEKIDWKDPDLKHTTQATTIKLSAKPFSKGAMRTASGMIDMSTNKRLVAKRYYKHTPDTNEVDLIRKDIEAQAIAKYLAMDFSSSEGSVAIDFIFTCWYEILDSSGKNVTAVLSAEPYIGGDYKKYNNNNGWINEEFGEAAQAFSHFTWQRTYGNLMVVDLQGVNFILTDPQIHSLDESKYGIGNLGSDGMCSFFLGHKCNNVCKALRLIPFNKDSSAVSIIYYYYAIIHIHGLSLYVLLIIYTVDDDDGSSRYVVQRNKTRCGYGAELRSLW
jgi:vacuole morphology and inheritance protein 14